MKYILLIIAVFLFSIQSEIYSQPEKAKFEKDIVTEKYLVKLENNETDFFSGKIFIYDKNSSAEVFKDEDLYTNFNSDTLIDMDKNGRNELILDLSTGVNMYNYNMYLIFDFPGNEIIVSEVHNAYFVTDTDNYPKIVSVVRLSPIILGTEYSYLLKYKNGTLIPETNPADSRALKELDISEQQQIEFMSEYIKETGECTEDSQVQSFYEAFITQKKILGQEKKGWKFFDKNYKCKDRKKVKAEIKKFADDNYKFIMNPENFKYDHVNEK